MMDYRMKIGELSVFAFLPKEPVIGSPDGRNRSCEGVIACMQGVIGMLGYAYPNIHSPTFISQANIYSLPQVV